MKVTGECVPCLLKRGLYETRLVGGDEGEATKAALEVLHAGYDPSVCSASLASRMHKAVYDTLGTDDPYRELKEGANAVAEGLLPGARKFVEAAPDRLRAAAICAVVGNVMDFGIEGSFEGPGELQAQFALLCDEGLGHDDIDRARNLLKEGSRVVYLFDNCGEVIFDVLMVEELRSLGAHVTVVVKGEPILTDATLEDARRAGMEEAADRILDTGTFAIGLDLDAMPEELRAAMDGADLIISKGMANYEALSDRPSGPVLHLMRTKCRAVADSLGLPMGLSVAVFLPEGGEGKDRA